MQQLMNLRTQLVNHQLIPHNQLILPLMNMQMQSFGDAKASGMTSVNQMQSGPSVFDSINTAGGSTDPNFHPTVIGGGKITIGGDFNPGSSIA